MSRKTVLLFPGQGAYRGRYATALEYPVEVFTEDVELEADLGVDSVSRPSFCLVPPTVTSCRRGQRIFD